MGPITVEYMVINDKMTQDQLDALEFKKFNITPEMVRELINQNTDINNGKGEYVDMENLFIDKASI